ncbi:hypothetical protein GA0115253_1036374 [Streptomyces sp. Termitarium-T10T-6]|nr:hypothetical protein GA0115253_1036374 [Streptomyces sp. Termitarium-T10T-6]
MFGLDTKAYEMPPTPISTPRNPRQSPETSFHEGTQRRNPYFP